MKRKNIQNINNELIKEQKNLKEIFCENEYNNLSLLHYFINMIENETIKAQKVDKIDKENYLTKFCIDGDFSFVIVNILAEKIPKSQIKIALQRLEKCVIIYQSIDSLVIERNEIEKTQRFSKIKYGKSIEWQEEN
ncbi:hypothetical protein EB360_05260 [Campylobacter coli]|nr:hypothetical protein [Campylobacter coli]EAH4904058.1 hypothetical protein [Campylobacter coli]EAH5755747.1 hypothetical protein [Campylobacter coli]EAH6526717.1 hypothetical protein [Campylobacter coli]EAH6588403.1 hypothetical protein [Campylobacter coli]